MAVLDQNVTWLTGLADGTKLAIVVSSNNASEIQVFEAELAATTKYKIYRPLPTSGSSRKAAGTTFVFRHPQAAKGAKWQAGDVVGYIEVLDAQATFCQEEN